jgi:proteasome accessory factor C
VTRPAAQDRLARLLAIVPWVASRDGPAISDVCARFGVSERELLADLDLLFMCGVHPFTPDTLIEVDVAGGRVWIRFADWFRRPLRLTAPEALAVMSAGSALLGTPGGDPDGALSRALTKLGAVLGVQAGEALEVDLGSAPAGVLEQIQQAVARRDKIEIDYYSYGRDDRRVRTVSPWQVFNTHGHWYVWGWCDQAGCARRFRVDRIRSVTPTGESFPPPPTERPPAVYEPTGEEPLYVVDLAEPAHWVAGQYPNEGVEALPGGVLRVRLRASGTAWMERVLLRAGPHARVVEGDPSVAPAAARRLLRRYQVAAGHRGAGDR